MAGDLQIAIGSVLVIVGGFLLLSGLLEVALVLTDGAGGTLLTGVAQLAAGALLVAIPLWIGGRSLLEDVRARRRARE